MAELEETVYTDDMVYTTEVIVDAGSAGHEVVLADVDNDFVAEEVVVVDASGGQAINTAPVSSAISAPNGRKDVNGTLDSFDASNIVEVNEEEIHLDDGSEEMSVAIDLAKLSQGHFSHNDFKNSGYVFYTEDGRQASSLEDLNGRTVEVAEAPVQRSQQKMAYARMMADRQSAGSSSGMSPSSGNDSEKPRMSYAQLIAEGLVNAPDGMLTLSEIYNAISARHPYYKMEARNWQNSIRHNLTLNKSFTKVPRMSSSEGRGSYWKLEPGAESIIFKRSARNVNKSVNTVNSANTSLNTSSLNLSGVNLVSSGGMTEVTTANLINSPQTVQIIQQQPGSDASNNVIYVTMSTS